MVKAYIVFLFLSIQMYGQSTNNTNDTLENTESVTQFSSFLYPNLLDDEMHSNFNLSSRFMKNFSWQFEASNNAYRLSDLYTFNNRIVYHVSDKLYFFSGIASEFEFDKIENRMLPPRFISSSGVGYNFSENWNIEAKYEQQLNNTSRTFLSTPTLYSFHS
ncbi:MAG: hypothetical protein NWQ38_06790, partial [Cellulophaga sp.]|nr:hypothetical protein [Cellulophaga sp.]